MSSKKSSLWSTKTVHHVDQLIGSCKQTKKKCLTAIMSLKRGGGGSGRVGSCSFLWFFDRFSYQPFPFDHPAGLSPILF